MKVVPDNLNKALALRLASPIGEAKLRSISRSLNKSMAGITLEKPTKVCLLDLVSYGIDHPVSMRTIYELVG